ncbi:MAG: hypothetical protein AAF542_06495 [Pseudomonadota bacterium]
MQHTPIPFPALCPHPEQRIDDCVRFDPHQHLALELPATTWTLAELGYSDEEIAASPTPFAVSSPARLLSEAGVSALQAVARHLRKFTVSCERVQNMVRGGVYQSEFLRELCLSKEVSEFMSDVYGVAVAPHSMPSQLGHLNFAPDDLSQSVDLWHHDTLELDYVLQLSDLSQLAGGEFQYFMGTKLEAASLANKGHAIPKERIVSPVFPDAGYFIALQGSMVVHKAARLTQPGERITMVNGYVPLDINAADRSRFKDLQSVDPEHILYTEWSRHKAWLSKGKLQQLLEQLPFTSNKAVLVSALRDAIADVETAIEDLESDHNPGMVHYEPR